MTLQDCLANIRPTTKHVVFELTAVNTTKKFHRTSHAACQFIVLLVCAASVTKPVHATVISMSQAISDSTFTITNAGSTTASVDLTLIGVHTLSTDETPTGSASGSFNGSIMEGTTTLISFSAPGSFDETFTFDIAHGDSVILASTSLASANASASAPSGSATAVAASTGTLSFLTASSGVSVTIAQTAPAGYSLSVTGTSPPDATGLASFTVGSGGITFFSDSLTEGSRTVPLPSTTTTDLGANQTFTTSVTTTIEAEASVVPEPSTPALAGTVLLLCYAGLRRIRVA